MSIQKTCRSLIGAGLLGVATLASAGTIAKSPLTYEQLTQFNIDQKKNHEGLPVGVPTAYDWYAKGVIHGGNDPKGSLAITGWAQVFWVKGYKPTSNVVQVRNFQTFICTGSDRKWVLLQRGQIDGAQYRADFQANLSLAAPVFVKAETEASFSFAEGSAFHFWPAMGRASVPDPKSVCGILVIMEARVALPPKPSSTTAVALEDAKTADVIKPESFLVGLGADYWTTKTAVWDNFKTNRDVGAGRLYMATKDWKWIGFSTASDADLLNLYQKGYDTGVFK